MNSASSTLLTVPASPAYARVVRMCAASLAAVADLTVDDVEDARMAAEEGFVYACATGQDAVEVSFGLEGGEFTIDFSLGDEAEVAEDESLDLVEALLDAVCEDFGVTDEGTLSLVLRTGGAHGDR